MSEKCPTCGQAYDPPAHVAAFDVKARVAWSHSSSTVHARESVVRLSALASQDKYAVLATVIEETSRNVFRVQLDDVDVSGLKLSDEDRIAQNTLDIPDDRIVELTADELVRVDEGA